VGQQARRGKREPILFTTGHFQLSNPRLTIQKPSYKRSNTEITVDTVFGKLVEAELQRHGVDVWNQVEVTSIQTVGDELAVSGTHGFSKTVDFVLVAVGVQPNSELGATAGAALGARGSLRVTRRMETNLPDVYAAGDCVETWHRLLNRYAYLPLGTTAHKQGRIAGESAVGGNREFEGSLGTQVVKLFDLVIARTGLRYGEASRRLRPVYR
jgi:NADPH-dependent 2,4-dienoyl-CoA reductase/sulfur reductase-like enzyme